MKDEYFAITKDIKITIKPEFLSGKDDGGEPLFIWAYHVKIHNYRNESVQLINRYWKIIDEAGKIEEVSGEGVVGNKPLIESKKSFEYSSGVHLKKPSGIMRGQYRMQKANGDIFDVEIPAFSLDIPSAKITVN
jgi:ApaG protein